MKLHEVHALLQNAIAAAERFFEGALDLPPTEALEHYASLKEAYDSLGATMKILYKLQQRQQYDVMPGIMINNNIRNYTSDRISKRFQLSTRLSCSMLDKPRGHEWLRENGQGDIIVPTVNAQTLAAFAKSYIEDTGLDLPDDIFKVHQATGVSVVKAAKKAK